jgi:tRNA 2-selenouridine synthase SelU
MTREDKLYSMRMQDLVNVAENLGIKINTKASKSKAIEKILAAEEMNKKNDKELAKEETAKIEEPERLRKLREERNKAEAEVLTETAKAVKKIVEKSEPTEKPERKRGALIEYNGKAQNICAWARELGVSANTLYSRIYILGWDVEKAFEYKKA